MSDRICVCGHPEGEHYEDDCIGIADGPGFQFCRCRGFRPKEE